MPCSAAHSRKNIYALFNSSQSAATGSFSFSRYRYRLIVLDYWVVKHFVFVYFFEVNRQKKIAKDCIFKFQLTAQESKLYAGQNGNLPVAYPTT